MKNNQKGFSVVEGLLLLVIVGIIGFVGWYVWQAKNNTDKNLNAASSMASVKPATKTTQTTTATPPPTTPAQTYLTLTEWSVKIPTSGALTSTKYQDVSSAYGADIMQVLTTDSSATNVCKGGTIGWVLRTTTVPSDPSGPVSYSHVGNYYYAYQIPQDCTASDTVGAMAQLKQAVGQMVATN